MDALKAAEKKMEIEMNKWIDINHCAMALVLKRYWGYGAKRIQGVETMIEDTWEECAGYADKKSILQMLEEETGIEIRNFETNKSFHDLAYFNNEIKMDPKRMNRAQWIYMRNQQAKWMRPTTLACILLGLHRKQGFGTDRLIRFNDQMNILIDTEYSQNKQALLDAALNEVNFVMTKKAVS